MKGNIDIISYICVKSNSAVNETKHGDRFTRQQFAIEGYHLPYRQDRDVIVSGGGGGGGGGGG